MVYTQEGVIKDSRPWAKIFAAGATAVTLAAAMFLQTFAVTATPTKYTEYPFNEAELSQWSADRTIPSGGFSSVDGFHGRDDVLQMNVNTSNQSQLGQFYYTEGLKRDANSSDTVRADLFVDSGSWVTNNVRAGLWGVGSDSSGEISAYPIAEYTTAGSTDGSSAVGSYKGWRVFNDEAGSWINLPSAVVKNDTWNNVEIKFNSSTTAFDVYINGVMAGSSVATGSVNLSSVILNNYNYGSAGADYQVHWSNFALGKYLTNKDGCKNGSYAAYGFKNQGACVSYLQANEKASFKRQ